jgi:hypothetical protein
VGDTYSVESVRKSQPQLLEYWTMDKVQNSSNSKCFYIIAIQGNMWLCSNHFRFIFESPMISMADMEMYSDFRLHNAPPKI